MKRSRLRAGEHHDPTPYDTDLDRNPANFQPLTPLTLLERAASVFPDQLAIVHGPLRRSYREFYARTRKLASALRKRGIGRGDTVSAVLANTPAMLECHYGVPMAGAVLNTINTRLDAAIIAFQLDHGDAKVLIVDREFSKVVKEALALCKVKPLVDRLRRSGIFRRGRAARQNRIRGFHQGRRSGVRLADAGRRMGRDHAQLHVGHHRRSEGRGLSPPRRASARGQQRADLRDGPQPVYLWTLPMFHCNGWCFPWTISVVAGTHVCLRAVRAKAMYDAIAEHKVTHLCGAPIVMSTLLNAPAGREEAAAARRAVRHRRRAAARGRARGDEGGGLQRHPCLWADRDLRPRGRQRMARRVGRAAARRAGGEESAAGRALPHARSARRARSRDHEAGAARRRDARRGDVPRQRGDEGLSEEQAVDRGGVRRRLVSLRRSRRDAPGRLHPAQGPLQGHHHLRRREHLVDRGRGRALQASRRCRPPPWWPSPTTNGARRRAPSSS